MCNEIDIETNCFATESLVRKCIRNQIWCNNKFVLDNTIKNMKIENKTNPKSVLNILLRFTQKETLNSLNRLKFWKRYGPMVQQEINLLKTICLRAIKDEIMIGEFILYSFNNYYSILTQIDILFIGLKREYKSFQENQSLIDNSEQDQSRQNIHDIEDTVLRTLTIRKGKCPEEERGLYHKLLSLGWHTREIETVLETDNEDLLYIFYVCCVSRSVRKRKWNESSQTKKLSSFVDPSDEAFAMLVLENNVLKWIDELQNGEVIDGSAIRMSLYTQSEKGRKWSTDGIMRFIELWKVCNEYRSNSGDKSERYHKIEELVYDRECIWNENSSRKRRKMCGDNEQQIEENEDENEMERILQAMVNGEGSRIAEE